MASLQEKWFIARVPSYGPIVLVASAAVVLLAQQITDRLIIHIQMKVSASAAHTISSVHSRFLGRNGQFDQLGPVNKSITAFATCAKL